MDKDTLNNLKKLAENATPGPWKTNEILSSVQIAYEPKDEDNDSNAFFPRTWGYGCGHDFICDIHDGEYHNYRDDEERYANCRYIAAANPAVVLALIEKIKRLEEDFDAAARSAADESVKAVKLEEEADWLAQQASLMCDCIENCDECRLFSECGCNGANSKEIWRKAAQEAISQEEARIKESEPDA